MEGDMVYFPCPTTNGTPECPYSEREKGCHEVDAHLFYPAYEYKTDIERVFRNLPENRELRCRRFEEISHRVETPPEKPPREHMVERIAVSGVYLSASKRKRIFK